MSEPKKGVKGEQTLNQYEGLGDGTNLVGHIMKATSFTPTTKTKSKTKGSASKGKGSAAKKKQTDNVLKGTDEEVITPLEISKMLSRPQFRYVPDRATLQRLVMRYVGLKDEFKGFEQASMGDTLTITQSKMPTLM